MVVALDVHFKTKYMLRFMQETSLKYILVEDITVPLATSSKVLRYPKPNELITHPHPIFI